MSKYRVFISYSHQDLDLVLRIVQILEDNDLTPMWDRDFAYGQGFHKQIKNFIAHAHIFLPIITETSDQRKWVHQEIGYAMALNVPVLPVAVGKLPGEMLREIHAIQAGADLSALKQPLSRAAIHNLVRSRAETGCALYQCAEFAEDRASTMVKYCDDVSALGFRDVVRQKGALSSFHIPDKTITHPVWQARYGPVNRGHGHTQLQRKERIALEDHARTAGCKLIINPYIVYVQYGDAARRVRLECLLEFLASMPDDKCQVAIHEQMEHAESVTILGDWFAAESVSAQIGQGYRQTIFTRHAPSMMSKIDAFDQEFRERLAAHGWVAETSRTAAISTIQEVIAGLKQ